MNFTRAEVKTLVKIFILAEIIPGENEEKLTDEVELMTLGILDSITAFKLVDFLETRFDIAITTQEIDEAHLNTLSLITDTVCARL